MRTLRELKVLASKELDVVSYKVAVLGDTATQLLVTSVKGEAAARNIALDIYEGEYNQIERQLLDPTSDLYQFDASMVVIFQSTHKLCEYHSQLSAERQEQVAEERLSFLASVCENPAFA